MVRLKPPALLLASVLLMTACGTGGTTAQPTAAPSPEPPPGPQERADFATL